MQLILISLLPVLRSSFQDKARLYSDEMNKRVESIDQIINPLSSFMDQMGFQEDFTSETDYSPEENFLNATEEQYNRTLLMLKENKEIEGKTNDFKGIRNPLEEPRIPLSLIEKIKFCFKAKKILYILKIELSTIRRSLEIVDYLVKSHESTFYYEDIYVECGIINLTEGYRYSYEKEYLDKIFGKKPEQREPVSKEDILKCLIKQDTSNTPCFYLPREVYYFLDLQEEVETYKYTSLEYKKLKTKLVKIYHSPDPELINPEDLKMIRVDFKSDFEILGRGGQKTEAEKIILEIETKLEEPFFRYKLHYHKFKSGYFLFKGHYKVNIKNFFKDITDTKDCIMRRIFKTFYFHDNERKEVEEFYEMCSSGDETVEGIIDIYRHLRGFSLAKRFKKYVPDKEEKKVIYRYKKACEQVFEMQDYYKYFLPIMVGIEVLGRIEKNEDLFENFSIWMRDQSEHNLPFKFLKELNDKVEEEKQNFIARGLGAANLNCIEEKMEVPSRKFSVVEVVQGFFESIGDHWADSMTYEQLEESMERCNREKKSEILNVLKEKIVEKELEIYKIVEEVYEMFL